MAWWVSFGGRRSGGRSGRVLFVERDSRSARNRLYLNAAPNFPAAGPILVASWAGMFKEDEDLRAKGTAFHRVDEVMVAHAWGGALVSVIRGVVTLVVWRWYAGWYAGWYTSVTAARVNGGTVTFDSGHDMVSELVGCDGDGP